MGNSPLSTSHGRSTGSSPMELGIEMTPYAQYKQGYRGLHFNFAGKVEGL